jgi:hypothetical protein
MLAGVLAGLDDEVLGVSGIRLPLFVSAQAKSSMSSSMTFGHPPPPCRTLVHPQTEPSCLDMIVNLRPTVVAAQFHPGQG